MSGGSTGLGRLARPSFQTTPAPAFSEVALEQTLRWGEEEPNLFENLCGLSGKAEEGILVPGKDVTANGLCGLSHSSFEACKGLIE